MNSDDENGSADGASPVARPRSALCAGLVLIFLILGLLAWFIADLHAHFVVPGQWVVLYVGIALLTGLMFWIVCGSRGTVTMKALGMQLGGGAAIGMSFMMMAHKITPKFKPSPLRIVAPVIEAAGSVRPAGFSPGVRSVYRLDAKRWLIELESDARGGEFYLRYLKFDGSVYQGACQIDIARDGFEYSESLVEQGDNS